MIGVCVECGKRYEIDDNEELSDFQCTCGGRLLKGLENDELGVLNTSNEFKPSIKEVKGNPINLISCPDCGHEVSKKANKCPNCGRRLNPEPDKGQKCIMYCGLICFIIFVIAVIYGLIYNVSNNYPYEHYFKVILVILGH